MRNYKTKSGDMWDWIAFSQMGSCNHVERLINANREHIETFIFRAGVVLTIPDVETKRAVKLPPWRR